MHGARDDTYRQSVQYTVRTAVDVRPEYLLVAVLFSDANRSTSVESLSKNTTIRPWVFHDIFVSVTASNALTDMYVLLLVCSRSVENGAPSALAERAKIASSTNPSHQPGETSIAPSSLAAAIRFSFKRPTSSSDP